MTYKKLEEFTANYVANKLICGLVDDGEKEKVNMIRFTVRAGRYADSGT